MRFQPACDHRLRQFWRRPFPQRKHRRDAGAGQLLFAIGSDVGEKQIAEDHVRDAASDRFRDRLAHPRLVDLVRARVRNRHDPLRRTRGLALRLQYLLPHAVDRYPAERLGHRGQRADDIEFTRAQHFMQRERRVLAARPGDQCFRACHPLIYDPRRRCLAGRASGSGSFKAPIRRNAASAARSPLSQAPSMVPHSVSWVASPARYMQPMGSVKTFRNDCPPGPAADIAPSANGAAFQRVALDFFTAAAASLPYSLVSHSAANATMAFSPCAERSRPNEPATSRMQSDEPPILADISAVLVELLCSMTTSSRARPSGLPAICSAIRS